MNEKLIIRAACKFRQWVIEESLRPQNVVHLQSHVRTIIEKSEEIKKWSQRFIRGITPRTQSAPYPPYSKSYGIVTPSVYADIAIYMVPNICEDIKHSMDYVSGVMKSIAEPGENVVTTLSVREAYEEILIIHKAWPDTEYRDGILSVLFKKVVLEDGNEEVDLGDFRAELHLSNPLEGLVIQSISCVESEGGYHHPHVSGNNLCTGDGGLSMKDALCQGRLEDYFRIVEAVLRTYNEASPHEELTEWYDPQHEGRFYCESCEQWRLDEDSLCCGGCDHIYCEGCDTCGVCCSMCEEWRCGECSTCCENCENIVCNNCYTACSRCSHYVCDDCLSMCAVCEEHLCNECCSECCANCGDKMCKDCTVTCECCEDNNCSTCVCEKCNECDKNICKGCQTTCDECGQLICITCEDSKCEHCGCSMCETCLEEHNCILSKM